ncbi:hypothetical protein CVS40_8779 [Lucilia cuprina]|nr:hypothetical protein CVS40_8779 [Lucilia cuprina]
MPWPPPRLVPPLPLQPQQLWEYLEKIYVITLEHEVSSTQEPSIRAPTKSKQNGEKFRKKNPPPSNAKDKGGGTGSSCSSMNVVKN